MNTLKTKSNSNRLGKVATITVVDAKGATRTYQSKIIAILGRYGQKTTMSVKAEKMLKTLIALDINHTDFARAAREVSELLCKNRSLASSGGSWSKLIYEHAVDILKNEGQGDSEEAALAFENNKVWETNGTSVP